MRLPVTDSNGCIYCGVGYCKDCKWWDKFSDQGDTNILLGECLKAAAWADGVHANSLAQACYHLDDAILTTSPDFGCNQFEAKCS